MLEQNVLLAKEIDKSIYNANKEVSILRFQLRETNERLSQIKTVTGKL